MLLPAMPDCKDIVVCGNVPIAKLTVKAAYSFLLRCDFADRRSAPRNPLKLPRIFPLINDAQLTKRWQWIASSPLPAKVRQTLWRRWHNRLWLGPESVTADDAATATNIRAALNDSNVLGADAVNVGRACLSEHDIQRMATELNVRPEDVIEMETRMAGGDVALEAPADDDGDGPVAPLAYLADEVHEPTRVIEAHRRDWLASDGIALALDQLDARSRRIVEERWLQVNDDGSGGMTLHELAAEYGVSAERIRQIEVAAMKKMRKALTEVVEA